MSCVSVCVIYQRASEILTRASIFHVCICIARFHRWSSSGEDPIVNGLDFYETVKWVSMNCFMIGEVFHRTLVTIRLPHLVSLLIEAILP